MIEDYASGFRCWFVRGSRLYPLTSSKPWKTVDVAVCPTCKPPGKDCGCGFNAFFQKPSDEILASSDPKLIWGEIAGRGDTRLYDAGFRSSEAQILKLISPVGKHSGIQKYLLRKRYGVPIIASTDVWPRIEPMKKGETENLLGFSFSKALFFEQLKFQ